MLNSSKASTLENLNKKWKANRLPFNKQLYYFYKKSVKLITNKITLCTLLVLINGCESTSNRSIDINDACITLQNNKDWLTATKKAWNKWGVPISVQLSVIKHESSFISDAKAKTSTAYGYAQALDGTFKEYIKESGNYSANRTSFYDSTDFIGWYFNKGIKKIKYNPYDAATFYLTYHDGISGYQKGTHLNKKWLLAKLKSVETLEQKYRAQITKCGI